MTDPIYAPEKVLMVAMESTYGDDAAPDVDNNAIMTQNCRIMPMEGADVARELDDFFMGANPTILSKQALVQAAEAG